MGPWGGKNYFMLTLPDFKNKQLLFIQTKRDVKNRIKFHNDNIVFTQDDKTINKASCHRVFAVFIIGDISITSELIKQGLQYGVSFFFLKNNFELYASVNASAEGNYLLRMRQYAATETEELRVSRQIVKNKIQNQIRLLRLKDNKTPYLKREKEIIAQIESSKNQESLLGIEGNASKEFFNNYFKPLKWRWRMPRVKPDIPNFLLDMGYTMLFNIVDSLLKLHGFDTYKGCYHKLFFQRKSLACDIVEPFRPIIDRQVLKMHSLKQVDESDFKAENGRVISSFFNSQKYARVFLETIMENREEIFKYVQGFYRFIMNSERNSFPEFKISR